MRDSPLFRALRSDSLELLLKRARVRRCEAGESIFLAGEPAQLLFLVVAGRAKVFQVSARGNEQILHSCGPGESFGEAALCDGGAFPAHAQALEPTVLLGFPRQALLSSFASRPDLAAGMLAGLALKLRELVRLVEDLSLKEVPERLAGALLDEAARARSWRLRLRPAKKELAARIGTIPETLSRALRRFQDAGWIEMRGAQLAILKPDQLERLRAGERASPADRPGLT